MYVCVCWICITAPFCFADTNNDRFLDPIELEALFFKEVNDIYGDDRDQTEIREEMSRMREHVLEEVGIGVWAWRVVCGCIEGLVVKGEQIAVRVYSGPTDLCVVRGAEAPS